MQLTQSSPTPLAPGPQRLSDDGFDRAMAVLMAVWPKEIWPHATLRVYRAVVSHLDDDTLLHAVLRCVHTATFVPKPAEILASAHELLSERGDGPPIPEAAWRDVLAAIRRDSTHYLHPTVRYALDACGGLRALGQCSYDSLSHYHARFTAIYRTLCGRHFLSLAGLSSLPDTPPGLPPPTPAELEYVPDPN